MDLPALCNYTPLPVAELRQLGCRYRTGPCPEQDNVTTAGEQCPFPLPDGPGDVVPLGSVTGIMETRMTRR